MQLLLGIDGGGTTTSLVAADAMGAPRARVQVAGSSLSRHSALEVASILATGVERCGLQGADVAAVCGGFASAGDAARQTVYHQILQTLLPRARVQVLTDAELAWHGAAGGADALVVLAGTGSIAWGRRGGRQFRAGGAGPNGDAGSGDWIGRQAVAAGLIAEPEAGDYAALLPALAHAPARAKVIFRRAGRELALLAATCARGLEWSDPEVYLWGGVFDHVSAVRQAFCAACPWPPRRLRTPPVEAALGLARAALDQP